MKFSWRNPCRKSSGVHEPVKLSLIKKGKKESDSAMQESTSHMAVVKHRKKEQPSLRVNLLEPVETDYPIRCPQPERGILHEPLLCALCSSCGSKDGQIFKERLKAAVKTKGELTFLTEKDVQSVLQRRGLLFGDRPIFPSASAPEPSISHLLE